MNCEPENEENQNAVVVTTQRGDTVGHIPEILAQVLVSEIRSENIVSVEAIVTGEPINALGGIWVLGGIETPCKYYVYGVKKNNCKIRNKLTNVMM